MGEGYKGYGETGLKKCHESEIYWMQISVADLTGKVPMLAVHRYIVKDCFYCCFCLFFSSFSFSSSSSTATPRRLRDAVQKVFDRACTSRPTTPRRVAFRGPRRPYSSLFLSLSHRMQIDAPGSRRESRLYIRSILPLFPNCRATPAGRQIARQSQILRISKRPAFRT